MHYSNPYVNYYTTATGRPPTGPVTDNAQQIRDSGCDIADFFPNQELGVFVDYAPVGCNANKTFTASILEPESGLPGVPPYTVSWYSNNSGVFQYPGQNIQFLGTGSSITLTQNPHCPVYWIKCIVQSSDDVVASRIIRVDLGPINCCSDDPGEGGGEEGGEGLTGGADERNPVGSSTTPINIRSYPNPNNGDQLILEGEGIHNLTRYELIDPTGRLILQNPANLQVGNQQQRISVQLPDIKSGIYFLRLSTLKTSWSVHKLFIIKP